MSTPINPIVGATGGEVPVPQPSGSPSDAEIRALAAQLVAMSAAPPPLVLDQGVIADVNHTDVPPTCSITLAGSSTQIDAVRYLTSYTPVIGDTIVVLRQNGSPLVIGHTADLGTPSQSTGGWLTPTLAGGVTTNGNLNGPIQYRKINDNGYWKLQWQGSVAITGAPATIMTMATGYFPSVKRSIITTRDPIGGSLATQLDFNTDGTVAIISNVDVAAGGHTHSSPNTGDNSDSNANHGGFAHHHGTGPNGTASNHTHTAAAPAWIALNGIEYFL